MRLSEEHIGSIAVVVVILCLIGFGCVMSWESKNTEKLERMTIDSYYSGKHELFSLSTFTNRGSESSASGTWFIVFGGYSESTKTYENQKVRFSWKTLDSSFCVSEISLNQVRFNIIDSGVQPFCTFDYVYDGGVFFGDDYLTISSSEHKKEPMAWVRYVTLNVPNQNVTKPMKLELE